MINFKAHNGGAERTSHNEGDNAVINPGYAKFAPAIWWADYLAVQQIAGAGSSAPPMGGAALPFSFCLLPPVILLFWFYFLLFPHRPSLELRCLTPKLEYVSQITDG